MSPYQQNKENFVKIHQIQRRLVSSKDEYITSPCYFKIVSDKNYREGHTLLVADGSDKSKDYLQLEFKPNAKPLLNTSRGKIYWPGSIVKGQMLKILNNKVFIVENSHLQILSSTKQLPPSLPADKFNSIPVEKRNIKLRDLIVLKETSPISESLVLKITGKTVGVGSGGQECINLKTCDESGRLSLKVWNSAQLKHLMTQVQVGDFWRFKNLILRFYEKKHSGVEGAERLFLQNVPNYTKMEKLSSKEIGSFPKIPAKLALGDADFHGRIIGMERFEWTSLCHDCPNLIKTSNCKTHEHGPELDIRSYSFRLIGYDAVGEKKEFFVRKEQVETFRNKSIALGREIDDDADADERLCQAFETLLEQPVNIIYNISMKSPHVLFATQVTLNPDQQEDVRETAKKKKKRPALSPLIMDEEENEKKKKKKKKQKKVKTVVVVDNDDEEEEEEDEEEEEEEEDEA